MQRRSTFAVLALASAVSLLCLTSPAAAQPSAKQVLTDFGLSADDVQRVMNGEFVTNDIPGVNDQDLSIAIAFLVKAAPADLANQIMAGNLINTDTQVQASGKFTTGTVADLSGLQITSDTAQTLTNASAGESLNLGANEITAFNALQGGTQQAILQQLQQMLLARYQAYKTSGLAGITPYARGGGSTDVAADLRKASQAAKGLQKYLPGFQQVLLGFPQATVPGMQQNFLWLNYNIDGATTFVLTHTLAATDGAARAVVQRQYYVSTGYNAEQAVAGFLPVQEGTVVAYTNHTFTDQVAGFGGSLKRSIGRRMMATKLKAMFDTARGQVH